MECWQLLLAFKKYLPIYPGLLKTEQSKHYLNINQYECHIFRSYYSEQ